MAARHIVLGGSGSIGSTLARLLAADGGHVVVAGRDQKRTEAVAAEVGGDSALLDARDADAVASLVEGVAAEGGLDTITCCVGSIVLAPAHRTTPDSWSEVIGRASCRERV